MQVDFSLAYKKCSRPCSRCTKIGETCYFQKGKTSGSCVACRVAHCACDKTHDNENESDPENGSAKKPENPVKERTKREKTRKETYKRPRSVSLDDSTRKRSKLAANAEGGSEQAEELKGFAPEKRLEKAAQLLQDKFLAILERSIEIQIYQNNAVRAINNVMALSQISQAELPLIKQDIDRLRQLAREYS